MTNRKYSSVGFSLVELLVALAIGLIGSLMMMQIFSQSEGGRRALGTLSDSQSSGIIGRFAIERGMQQGGAGVTDLKVLGCKITTQGGLSGKLLAPAAIVPTGAGSSSSDNIWQVPAGDPGSDMILVLTGSSSVMLEGTPLVAANSGADYTVENPYGLAIGDRMVISDGTQDCTISTVKDTDPGIGKVTLDWNSGLTYGPNASMFTLGKAAKAQVFAVRNGRLTACDFFTSDCANAASLSDESIWVPIASDVVALVAQYGWDTTASPDMVTDVFCKSRVPVNGACPVSDLGTPGAGNSALAQSQRACDWTRVPVIRLAVITRSGQYEKEEVSPASIKVWPDSATAPVTTGPVFLPGTVSADGRHYRYRITYSQIALRNMIWAGAKSSC